MSHLTPASQILNQCRPTRLACSSVDLLWVMSYTPSEGDNGTPISVNFSCKADLAFGIHIRLVVGRRAVSTQVHEIDAPGCGRWQLLGHAPSFAKQQSSSAIVPLTIQAVNKENQVVDSVTFGDFVYHDLEGGEKSHTQTPPTLPLRRPSLRIASSDGSDRPSKRPSPYSQPQTPSSSDSEYGSSHSSRPQPVTQSLRRASRQMASELENMTKTVILDITTSLDSFCYDWEESELNAGRRLVRFQRLQDGNKLIISAERIPQAEYDPDDIVISCIYRQETDSCCVTSVDIIHLLQRLVEADFEVDEKNRIRRNLEGLRPTTVSKTRPGFESFFQRIMDFPDPKPRKIEKDVKVFDWKHLSHALDKILSKYSLCTPRTTSSPTDERPSPPPNTMLPQMTSTGPPPGGGTVYPTGGSFQLPQGPHTDALYPSHISPAVQLAQYPSEHSPDTSPDLHRRSSMPEDQLQSIYLDAEIMRRYFPVEPDIAYGMPPSLGPLQSPMYTTESTAMLAPDPMFVGGQVRLDWTTQPTNDVVLTGMSPQEPMYSPLYGYNQSDSTESVEIHPTLPYSMSTYGSFDMSTMPPSQHA